MAVAAGWAVGPVIVGVMVGTVVGADVRSLLVAVAAAWAAAVLAFRRERPAGLLAAVALGSCGAGLGLGSLDRSGRVDVPLLHQVGPHVAGRRGPLTLEGTIRDDAAGTSYGAGFTLDVTRVALADGPVASKGGVRLSVAGELAPVHLEGWTRGRLVRVPAHLRRPQPYRNPGVADPNVALARREIAWLGSVKSAALVEVVGRGSWIEEAAAGARRWVRHRLRDSVGAWSPQSAAVAVAILIGDRAGLSADDEERLQRAGTYHVIAISGGNIAILTALLLLGLRACRVPHTIGAVAAALGVAGYAFLVGSGASVVRASLVAVLYLLGLYLDVRARPLALTTTAAGSILAARPLWWFDPGFWLTFGATTGILLGARRLTEPVRRVFGHRRGRRRLLSAVATGALGLSAATAAAEAALLPLGAFLFSRVTMAGLVLNLAAVPLMAVLQVSAIAAAAAAVVSPVAAHYVGIVPHVCAMGLLRSAALVDVFPWTTRRVPPPSAIVLAVYYSAWLAWFVVTRRTARSLALGAVTCAAIATLWAPPRPRWLAATPRAGLVREVASLERARGPLLSVVFFDVGQGDSAVVTFPDGTRWLVDTGGLPSGSTFDVGARVVGPALWAFGARKLDALVITHGHPDHAGGAPSIIGDFKPRVIWQGVPATVEPGPTVEARARQLGARLGTARAGDLVLRGPVDVLVLHPPPIDWERRTVRNDDSVGLEVRRRDVSLVMTGDAGAAVEPAIAAGIGPARIRLLKVPHHGSRGASSAPFLEHLQPTVAVVSSGAGNPFGHPADATLARYESLGVTLLRTDVEGAVWAGTDGRCLWVRTFAGRALAFGGETCRS